MEKWKFLTVPGLEPRPLSRPARSQSEYKAMEIKYILYEKIHNKLQDIRLISREMEKSSD
jgi:hypothetical protein